MKNQIYRFNLLAVTALLVCMVGCRGNDTKPSGGSSFTFPTDSNKRAWLYGEIDSLESEEEFSLQNTHEPFTIQDALIRHDELELSEKDSALIAWVNIYNASIIDCDLRSECENALVSEEAIKSPEPVEITENIISDAQLRTAAQHYIDSTRMVTTSPRSSEINPGRCEGNYGDCILSYHDKQQFPYLSEEDYDKHFDPTTVIPDYNTLLDLDEEKDSVAIRDLKKRILAAKNMDEKVLLLRIYGKYYRDDLATVTQALEQAQYSKYLPTLWSTWRAMYQEKRGGFSRVASHIYNRTYEYMRKHVALIIMRQIKEHPDDAEAHSTLLELISNPCITRFLYMGEFLYPGNSLVIEEKYLGWE